MSRSTVVFNVNFTILLLCFQVLTVNAQTETAKPDEQPAASKQDTAAEHKAKVAEAESIIKQFQADQWQIAETDAWVKLLKELVDLGPAAVDPICNALRNTDRDFEMRVYGFALRSIGDPRAVQALIESLPKTLLPPGSDYGLKIVDKQLAAFMRENDLDEKNRGQATDFRFGRPIREINSAIGKLTEQKIGVDGINSVFLDGGPLQICLRRKLYYDHTVRWYEWWSENYESRGVNMDYVDIELAEFEFKRPKIVNEFVSAGVQTSGSTSGNILGAYDSVRDVCFFDLDTGRRGRLPKEFDADSTIDEVSRWARGEGFDLVGVSILVAGKEQSKFVIKPLGMKAWQNPASRYEKIDKQVGQKDLEMGTPAKEYLAYYDEQSDICDPDKEVTFLFQTKEGTCGAIKVECQVTELITKEDYGKRMRQIPKYRGGRLGVKFETKLFVTE